MAFSVQQPFFLISKFLRAMENKLNSFPINEPLDIVIECFLIDLHMNEKSKYGSLLARSLLTALIANCASQ